jgi:polyisoprenyl-teichoic acid--peptidoglycan teichoic acid transferase
MYDETESDAPESPAKPTQVNNQPIYVPRTPPPPPPIMRESAARSRIRQRRGRHNGGEWAWVIIAGTLLGIVLLMGVMGFIVLRSSSDEPEIMPTAAYDLAALPTPVDFRNSGQFGTGELVTLDNGYSFILEPWDGNSRFTLLAMGMDRRPGETGLAYRTDTMMLISIDPESSSIGILSIPRDLYVEIRGWGGRQRINTAMALGEGYQTGYGPQLVMETVMNNFGIRIHDYVLIDFNAVIGLVDAIGGITITTDYTIDDPLYPDMNYGYDPFYLPPGTHLLNGYDALRFARTRHGDNDIERAGRQQQFLYAVRDKVLDLDMLRQLIVQGPSLLATFQDNVYTGLSLDQMIKLAWYIKDIPEENIKPGVVGFEYLRSWQTPGGAQVLIPNQARLADLMVEIFGPNYIQ